MNVKLNKLSEQILNYWNKEFDEKIKNKINFLKKNLHDQEVYNSIFAELIEEMSINENIDENEEKEDVEGINIEYIDIKQTKKIPSIDLQMYIWSEEKDKNIKYIKNDIKKY